MDRFLPSKIYPHLHNLMAFELWGPSLPAVGPAFFQVSFMIDLAGNVPSSQV
jgi:hypothetical protein